MRAREKSAEAVVVKIAAERRQERRAEETGKRDQPSDSGRDGGQSSETSTEWQQRPLLRRAKSGHRGGLPDARHSRGASHPPGETREDHDARNSEQGTGHAGKRAGERKPERGLVAGESQRRGRGRGWNGCRAQSGAHPRALDPDRDGVTGRALLARGGARRRNPQGKRRCAHARHSDGAGSTDPASHPPATQSGMGTGLQRAP